MGRHISEPRGVLNHDMSNFMVDSPFHLPPRGIQNMLSEKPYRRSSGLSQGSLVVQPVTEEHQRHLDLKFAAQFSNQTLRLLKPGRSGALRFLLPPLPNVLTIVVSICNAYAAPLSSL